MQVKTYSASEYCLMFPSRIKHVNYLNNNNNIEIIVQK